MKFNIIGATICLGVSLLYGGDPSLSEPMGRFKLFFFNDAGQMSWKLLGKQGEQKQSKLFLAKTVKMHLYEEKDSGDLDATIRSDEAEIYMKSGKVMGDDWVAMLGHGYQIKGNQWQWEAGAKKLNIEKHVQVTFDSELLPY